MNFMHFSHTFYQIITNFSVICILEYFDFFHFSLFYEMFNHFERLYFSTNFLRFLHIFINFQLIFNFISMIFDFFYISVPLSSIFSSFLKFIPNFWWWSMIFLIFGVNFLFFFNFFTWFLINFSAPFIHLFQIYTRFPMIFCDNFHSFFHDFFVNLWSLS